MKKYLILLLVVVFSVSMLFIGIGCKAEEAIEEVAGEEEAPPAEEEEEESPPAEEEEQITITWWHWEKNEANMNAFHYAFDNFMEKYPNVVIEETIFGFTDHYTALKTALAAGEGPDLMELIPGADISLFAGSGNLYDFRPDIEADPEWSEWTEPFTKVIDFYHSDGGVYVGVFDIAYITVNYWKDLYPNGFPRTIEELYVESDRLIADDIIPIVTGWADTWSQPFNFSVYAYQADPDDTLIPLADIGEISWENDVFKEAFLVSKDLYDRGIFAEDSFTFGYDIETYDNFISKKAAAMWPSGAWLFPRLDDEIRENGEIGTAPMPMINEEAGFVEFAGLGSGPAINADSKNLAMVLELVKSFYDPKVREMVMLAGNSPVPFAGMEDIDMDPVFMEHMENLAAADTSYKDIITGEFDKGFVDGLANLLLGIQTVDEVLANMEAISKEVYPDASHAEID